jgi:glyoxylase-like metal-dependent hydrolase (beta-lactamase superfamily II)
VSTPSQTWTEPGPEQVIDGVHRIPLPMPGDSLTAVNVYAIVDGAGVTLIDGGWAVPEARSELGRALKTIGVSDLRDISRVLVTHAHRDHYTLAVLLRREFGIPISVGAGERPALEALAGRTSRYGAQVRLLERAGGHDLARRVEGVDSLIEADREGWELPDSWLEAGRLPSGPRTLQVVPTPGHTRGHVVYANTADNLLFTGDHVLPHITPSIGFETVPAESPLRDYLDSLATIRALPDMRMLPAHGPLSPSTHQRVDELVVHHDVRLAETVDIVDGLSGAGGTAADVAAELRWTRRRRSYDSLDTFNQMLAVTETVAHLELLAHSGVLVADRTEERITYRAVAS